MLSTQRLKKELRMNMELTELLDALKWIALAQFRMLQKKKERFVRYLEIFLSQSEAEVGNWQVWTEQKQHEPLAFSVHKLLPYIRIFMDEKTAARAVELDQELRKGWTESHPDILLLLKKEILISRQEASDLLQVLDG